MLDWLRTKTKSRFSKICTASFFFGLVFSFPFLARATLYLPGETLDPDCAPGSVDCGVLPIGDAHTGSGAPALVDPNAGALFFDTTGGIFYAYDGTSWVAVGSGTSITSLNGQTGPSQTFVIGSAGTDFNISSASDVHTLNIPDASALNRGLVTTGAQTIAGAKTFSGGIASTGWSIVSAGTATGLSIAAGTNTISGLTNTNLSGTAGITNANLANSAVAVTAGSGLINGGSVSLGGSMTLDIGAGSGITANTNDIAVNLTTSGTTGSTSSNSGLEVSSSGVALLKGCADAEILKWTDASGWACAADSSGGSSTLQAVYDNGNTILTTTGRNIAFTLGEVGTPTSLTIDNQDTAGVSAQRLFNSIASGTLTNGLLIEQTGVGTMTNGIQIAETAGTIADGILITGTLGNILNSSSLDITGAGAITGATGITLSSGDVTTTGSIFGNDFDRSTAGALTFGNTNATSVSICNSAGCDTITLGTNADADIITIGDTLDALSIASTGLNLSTAGALTGVASIDTIATSATAITFAGAGTITGTTALVLNSTGVNAVTLDSTTTGDVNVGTGSNAKTVNIGTGTAGDAINIGTNNTTADTIAIGSALDTLTIAGNSSSTLVLNAVTLDATEVNRLDGHDAALVDTNDAVSTAITGTGVLGSGSITSGFGAIDTGADNITTTGTAFANDFDRSTVGALTFGNTNATSASLCNSAACDIITIGTNADADTITIGDTLDALSIASSGLNLSTAGAITGATGLTLTSGNITTPGNISTSSTGAITSAGLLTASNGFTLTTGALNVTATSGALALSGLSASSISAGANAFTLTSSNVNTTATGINATAIGATTASTGAFTTLSSTGTSNIGSGTGVVTINSSGALNLTAASASTWTLANVADSLNFDANTLSLDALNNRVGVGTVAPAWKLSVVGNTSTANIANVTNLNATSVATNSVMRLSTGTVTGNLTRFMQFYSGATTESDGTGVGRINLNNAGVQFTSGGADLAEWTEVIDSPVAGDIIASLSSGNQMAVTGDLVLGVVSDTAAFVGNDTFDLDGNAGKEIVGMLGRVNTRVSNENGDIAKGDPITASSVAGVGMKQTTAGPTIGKALAAKTGATVERIAVQVVPGWYDPDPLLTPSSFTISGADILDQNSDVVTRVGGFQDIFVGDVSIADELTLDTGILSLTATSGALALSGLSASSINTGANALTITSSNINTTATGINSTAIGATTASTGAFSTLSSTGLTNLASTGASNVTIATTGTGNVTIGNTTGTFALNSSSGLNVTTGGALTGVASIDTIATSATAITFAGAGAISGTTTLVLNSTGANAVTLDSTTTGTVNIGTGTSGKTINIGTNNTASDTIIIGSALDNVSIVGDQWSVTDAGVLTVVSCTGCGGGGATLDSAYTTGNTIGTDSGSNVIINLAEVVTPTEVTINNLDTAATNALQIDNGIASGALTNGLLLEESGAGTMTNGLHVLSSAGAITDGIHIEDGAGTIADGLQFTGTFTNLINSTNFSVSNAGGVTLAGVLAANGDSITADGATLTINAAGTVNIQDALDVVSTIQAGSGNETLTLATGKIDADALTLTAAVDGGTGTSSGSGLIARTDGIGLLQGCANGDVLRWVEATDTWDCAPLSSSTESANDTTAIADLPNGAGAIVEVMNSAEPTITPETTSSRIWVTGSIALGGDGTDDETSTFRVFRDTADDTACDGTQVDGDLVQFTTLSATDDFFISFNLIDSPATTSAVFYSVCGFTNTATTPNSVTTVSITIQEIPATGADLAELYATHDASLEAGDVVSLDPTLDVGVKKSTGRYASDVMGIVSMAPALVIGGIADGTVRAVPVALSGRVPVKVVTENGAIQAGDYLTASSLPGVAMKSDGVGTVIGQAMLPYSGEGVGVVLTFVKNFNARLDDGLGMEDVSPGRNADGSDNGLSTLVSSIQIEIARNPVAIISAKISEGQQFFTNFVSARVTAIRGYFDEVFARIVHTDQLCVKKADGSEVCVNGDQLQSVMSGVTTSAPSNASSGSSPSVPSPSEVESVIVPAEEVTPEPSLDTSDPLLVDVAVESAQDASLNTEAVEVIPVEAVVAEEIAVPVADDVPTSDPVASEPSSSVTADAAPVAESPQPDAAPITPE